MERGSTHAQGRVWKASFQVVCGEGLVQIIRVKIGLLLHTVVTSIWTLVFGLGLMTFVAVKRIRPGFFKTLRLDFPHWSEMMPAMGVGGLSALIVNDTGIIAAALVLVYYWLGVHGLVLTSPSEDRGQSGC